MEEPRAPDKAELERAFRAYEYGISVANARRAAMFAAFFMLAGWTLDAVVFPAEARAFLAARVLSALLLGGVFWILGRMADSRASRVVAQLIPLVPLVAICWMISRTGGGDSYYYAGLITILVGLSLLLRWSFWNSLGMILICFTGYGLAIWAAGIGAGGGWLGGAHPRILFNNVYFLFVISVFVVAGSYYYERLRFREFALRREVEDAREMLERQNRQLSELDEAKMRFFANISHELRTPLTIMLGLIERMKEHSRFTATPETMEIHGIMEDNGLRLLKLIDDLLDLVRFDSGVVEAERQPVALETVIEGLVRATRFVASQGQIDLHTDVELPRARLVVDRDKIEKILLNLIMNAIKFTPAGGRVTVSARHRDGLLELGVSDTGVGIAGERVPLVFERFWQVDTSSRRKFQGAGIGLALVKSLAEVMDGEISVASQEGKGTAFTIRLPAVVEGGQAPEIAATAETEGEVAMSEAANPSTGAEESTTGVMIERLHRKAALTPGISNRHVAKSVRMLKPGIGRREGGDQRELVLVADDEPDMRRFLALELENYELIEAKDGAEALALAMQRLPDLILLDHMMPEMDGVEVCAKLREHLPTQKTPILLVTARADERTKLEALRTGASDFIAKPFSSAELRLRIENQLSVVRYQKRLAEANREIQLAMEQLKEQEVLLIRNEKLSALGRMSAGIVHEINNPLNYALTGTHSLQSFKNCITEDEREDFLEVVEDVREGIKRVVQIVSDLRSFTKTGVDAVTSVKLSEVIEHARRLVSKGMESVQFHQDVPDHLMVEGNSNQLCQVFVNFFQNSVDAIGGQSRSELDGPGEIRVKGIQGADGEVEVVVRDNGPGIDPENMPKIFDPFFTMKDVGEGMGLGLSITHHILKRHGVSVDVHSEHGKFAEFRLVFPSKVPSSSESNLDEVGVEV